MSGDRLIARSTADWDVTNLGAQAHALPALLGGIPAEPAGDCLMRMAGMGHITMDRIAQLLTIKHVTESKLACWLFDEPPSKHAVGSLLKPSWFRLFGKGFSKGTSKGRRQYILSTTGGPGHLDELPLLDQCPLSPGLSSLLRVATCCIQNTWSDIILLDGCLIGNTPHRLGEVFS